MPRCLCWRTITRCLYRCWTCITPVAIVFSCCIRLSCDFFAAFPQGSWAPSMNVPTLLTTIRLLMAHPNGDDGLMPDIVREVGLASCFRLHHRRGYSLFGVGTKTLGLPSSESLGEIGKRLAWHISEGVLSRRVRARRASESRMFFFFPVTRR